jgi:uncharacterized cupredoxin-like copper-binding protein
MERKHLSAVPVLISLAALVVGACGGPAATASPTASASPTAVAVTLQEWAVGTSVATAKAGSVKFTVTNQGPDDTHEFVVIKTDLSLIALPTDATGAVDEAGGGMEVKGEIEDVLVGTTQDVTLTLPAGAYVLICNIYDETELEAHYQEGMRTSFTVTP